MLIALQLVLNTIQIQCNVAYDVRHLKMEQKLPSQKIQYQHIFINAVLVTLNRRSVYVFDAQKASEYYRENNIKSHKTQFGLAHNIKQH